MFLNSANTEWPELYCQSSIRNIFVWTNPPHGHSGYRDVSTRHFGKGRRLLRK